MVAAVSGIALIISLFLAWVGIDVPDVAEGIPGAEEAAGAADASGWESQSTLDLYLAIVALFAIVPAALGLIGSDAEIPFMPAAATFLLGAIGTLLMVYYVIDGVPEGGETKIGVWIALISVIGVTVGAYLAMQDELADEY
jgi:hypothetical protein